MESLPFFFTNFSFFSRDTFRSTKLNDLRAISHFLPPPRDQFRKLSVLRETTHVLPRCKRERKKSARWKRQRRGEEADDKEGGGRGGARGGVRLHARKHYARAGTVDASLFAEGNFAGIRAREEKKRGWRERGQIDGDYRGTKSSHPRGCNQAVKRLSTWIMVSIRDQV